MNYRNAHYIDETRIDCQIHSPVHGWIPYTLDPADTDMTTDNAALLLEMKNAGDVVAYTPPTQNELNAAKAEALMEVRGLTTITKGEFCKALLALGLLPRAEAKAAAKGDWPATFLRALNGMSEAEQDECEIEWSAATTIRRMHPLILMLAAPDNANLKPEQIDTIFGIGA